MRRAPALAAIGLMVALLGGCGAEPSAPPPSAATVTAAPSSPVVGPPATPAPAATATPAPASQAALAPPIEPGLLAVLPATVAGSVVEEDVDREVAFAADPERGSTVVGFAAAVVGDAGDNVATVAIARLGASPPIDFFEQWRADFDAAACAANDGVAGHEIRQIGNRAVQVTHCVGGAVVYHARLGQAGALIVSILSVGAGDFGRMLVEGLRQ